MGWSWRRGDLDGT